MYPPTKALDKIQFITIIKTYISAPGCLPQGVIEQTNISVTRYTGHIEIFKNDKILKYIKN
jgi:hypothetical protein